MVTAEEPEFKAAPTLYHLVEEPVWRAAQKAGTLYKPPTYEQVRETLRCQPHRASYMSDLNIETMRSNLRS